MTVDKSVNEKEYSPPSVLSSTFEWISAAIVAIIIVAIIFSVFCRIVNVDGESMTNTLQNGDRLLVSGLFYEPQYGDIVVLRRENDTPLIKRVIALPGDTIFISDQDGIVYRNGVPLDEPYIRPASELCPTPPNRSPAEITVGEGQIYVLGDNRGGSLDSRMLGCQSLDNLVGRVIVRLSPIFGKISNGE